jgi:Skp family chaperone for outer membrane proteins
MNNRTTQLLIGALLFAGVITTSLISNDDTGTLGPADSLVLSGADGDITINNNAGRMSWGEEKTSTVWSIGFMETGKALKELLKADHYQEARQDLNVEIEKNISGAREALDALTIEAQKLTQSDPNFGQMRQQWQKLYDEFAQLQQLAAEARNALYSEQMQESYKEIVEAVNVVAERLNVDMVLRFIPPDDEFEQGNPDSIIMQIRLRSALRTPDDLDITDEVLSELGIGE